MAEVFAFDPAAHRYTLNGVVLPGITQILELTGFVDKKWFTEESRDRGTKVHAACQFLIENDLDWDTVDPAILPRVKQFEQFLAEHRPTLILAEKPLYSAVHQFAGTPDLLVEIEGKLALVDIKTGKSGLAAELQTAAQKILIEEYMGVKVLFRFALELSGIGKYKLVQHNERIADKITFLNALAMVNTRINKGELKI